MATFTTANAVGEREDLSDVITRIDPEETPVFSALYLSCDRFVLEAIAGCVWDNNEDKDKSPHQTYVDLFFYQQI